VLGQFGHGNAALALQDIEDPAVDSVEFGHFTSQAALGDFQQRISLPNLKKQWNPLDCAS